MSEEISREVKELLDKIMSRDVIQPGDLTKKQIAARYGITPNAVLAKMRKAVEDGLFEEFMVFDPVCHHDVVVFRPVNGSAHRPKG